ncbi:group IIE secretory phospholipase A2-like [Pithys albifrons albifrons]|uniref:group IIE secretory phospholipase A2-like n=1 Tax=Pithys albifrons albifrons TaxID=3385563 RepID=UPI003A5CB9B8
MKLFSLLLFFVGLALVSSNVIQFGDMILRSTGKFPLAYNRYGCNCGFRTSKQPLDATDWCCHVHDCCYRRLDSSTCHPMRVFYKYHIQGGQITCGGGSHCQRGACACDKAAAECFRRTRSSYSNAYSNYPLFKCKGRAPSC